MYAIQCRFLTAHNLRSAINYMMMPMQKTILFTVAALPSKVSVGGPGPMMAMPPGATQGGNASLIVPGIPQGNNQKQPSVIQGQIVQQPQPKQMIE